MTADIIAPPVRAIEDGGAEAGVGRKPSRSFCSIEAVLAYETRERNPVSRPKAIAATPASTATPIPRRIHSPIPSERFIAAKTRPPTSKASASEVAAPAA